MSSDSPPPWRDYEALLDSVGGIVWEADPQTDRFRFVSKQAERLLGYPVRRWLEEPDFWVRHMHPDDRDWAPGFCRQAVERAQPYAFEYRMIAADGRVVWLRDVCTVTLEAGRPVSLRGVMVDVTERRRVDEALRVASERLRMVVANAPVILFAMDCEGVVTLCQGRGLGPAGIEPAEVLGRKVEAWARSTPRIQGFVRRALAGEEFTDVVPFEDRIFETRYAPLRGEGGRVEGVIGVATDVTERERSEEQRRALEAQVRHAQKLESLGVMAGGIAHDFNNLLTTILGNAALALEDLSGDAPAQVNVERIHRAARSAADLTNQLLAYAGQRQPDIQPLDLSELVAGMLELVQVSISKKARLEYELAEGLPSVEGDPTQLSQVVLNLVTNASDALRGEAGEIRVRTGLVQVDRAMRSRTWLPEEVGEGPHVLLEVSDTGSGMDAETRARIFDPFFSTKFVGRGLGLATVLGIVRGHGGAVRVDSQADQGTTFRVLLPCSERAPQAVTPKAAETPGWRGRGTVLVVDDEADVREIAAEMLQRLGFEVLAVARGGEAVARLRADPEGFALVLLDATMPEMSAEETVHGMRSVRADLPIVMMSGYREEFAASALAGMLAGFVHKPFSPEELARVMRRVLED